MTPELRAKMLKLAEGKSDGSASISLTADDLFSVVDSALYPATGPMLGRGHKPSEAMAALEGLAKLGYDSRDISVLKKYFDHCVEAEELRQEASRSFGRMRDEYYDDRDRKNPGMKANLAVRAY